MSGEHDNNSRRLSLHRSLQRPPASTHRSRSESRPRSAFTTTTASTPSSGKSTPRGGGGSGWARGAFFSTGSTNSSSAGGGGAASISGGGIGVSGSGSGSGRSTPDIGSGGNSRDSSRSRGRSPFGSFSFFGTSRSNSGSNLIRSTPAANGAKPSTPRRKIQQSQQDPHAGQRGSQPLNLEPGNHSKHHGSKSSNSSSNNHSAPSNNSQDSVADRVAAALIASGAGAASATSRNGNRDELTSSPAFSIASSNEQHDHHQSVGRQRAPKKAPFAPAKSSPPRAWGFGKKTSRKHHLHQQQQQQQQQQHALKSSTSQNQSENHKNDEDCDNEEKKEEDAAYDDDDEEEDLGAEMAAWADANGSSRGPSPALPLPSPAFGHAQPTSTPTPPPPPLSGMSSSSRSGSYSTFSSTSNSRQTSPLRRSSSSGAANGAPALSRSNSNSSNWLSRKRAPTPSNILGGSSDNSGRSAMATPDLASSSGAVQAPRKASPPQAWGWGGVGSSSRISSDCHDSSSSAGSGKRSAGGTPLFGASAFNARLPSPDFPADTESSSIANATATALCFSGRLSPALSPDGATTVSAATPALCASSSSTTTPAFAAGSRSGILSPTQFRAVSGENQTVVRPPSSSSLAAPSPAPGAGLNNLLFDDEAQPRSRSQQKGRNSMSNKSSGNKISKHSRSSNAGIEKKKALVAPEPLRTSSYWGSFSIYQSNANSGNDDSESGIASESNANSVGKPSDVPLARTGSSGSGASLGSNSSCGRSGSHTSSSNSQGPITSRMSHPRMIPLSSFPGGSAGGSGGAGAPSSPVSAPAEWVSYQPVRSTAAATTTSPKKKRSSSVKQTAHKPKGSPVGGSRGSMGSNSGYGSGSNGGGLCVKSSAVEKDAPINNTPIATPKNNDHRNHSNSSINTSSKRPTSEPKAPPAISSLDALLSPPPPSRLPDSGTSGDVGGDGSALTPKRSPLKGSTSFTTGHKKKTSDDNTGSTIGTSSRSGSSSRIRHQSEIGTSHATSSSFSVASAIAAEVGPELRASDSKDGGGVSPARSGGRLPPTKAASRPLASKKRPTKAPPRATSRYHTPN